MKVSERLAVIEKVAVELQKRYTYDEINSYLAAFGVAPPSNVSVNSKRIYVRTALQGESLPKLAQIVDDLGLGAIDELSAALVHPKVWEGTSLLRLFVSHIAEEKTKATRLRDTLAPYGISAFVAHEDIDPTLEWQSEIERALFCMDAFVAMHTRGFSSKFWTQQEVGFAVARRVKIISLQMGELPTGFISKHQALNRATKTAEQIAAEIDQILENDQRTKDRLANARSAYAALKRIDDLPF